MFCLGPFSVYCYQLVGVVTHVFSRFRREAISCVPLRQGKKQNGKRYFLKQKTKEESQISFECRKKKNHDKSFLPHLFNTWFQVLDLHEKSIYLCWRSILEIGRDVIRKKTKQKKSLRKWKGRIKTGKNKKAVPSEPDVIHRLSDALLPWRHSIFNAHVDIHTIRSHLHKVVVGRGLAYCISITRATQICINARTSKRLNMPWRQRKKKNAPVGRATIPPPHGVCND